MSLFSKLFGGKSSDVAKSPVAKPEAYNGYMITPDLVKEANGFRIGARIEKVIDGETRSHIMRRADVISSADDATKESLRKARIFVDQMGDGVFNAPSA